MTTRGTILFVILLIFGTSCARDYKPASDEAGFTQAMQEEFPGSNKEHNLDNGKNVCFKLRSGKTQEEVIMEKFDHGMSITNASTVVKLSVDFLCQDFK